MSVQEKLEEQRARYRAYAEEAWERTFRSARCGSPIEELLLGHLLARGFGFGSPEEFCRAHNTLASVLGTRVEIGGRYGALLFGSTVDFVATQLTVGHFRIDFAVFALDQRIAVELDGHEFHERTKEQARRDKSRDRWLTHEGWRVIRFTGAEVYRDVGSVWDEVEKLIDRLTCPEVKSA